MAIKREPQGPVTVQPGQTDVDPQKAQGITETAPQAPEISPKAPDAIEGSTQTGEPTSPPESEPGKPTKQESFFDFGDMPEAVKTYLEGTDPYKLLQASYSKKTQALAKERQKVEAYDAFMADPETSLKRAVEQIGMRMEPIGRTSTPGTSADVSTTGNFSMDWHPENWPIVGEAVDQRIDAKLNAFFEKLQPLVSNIKTLITSNVERQLSEIDSDWKAYEDEMMETLKAHPTLKNDVAKLYRISVPEVVLNARATQAALKNFEDKAASAKIQGKSSIRSATSSPLNKKRTFDEAIQFAREEIAKNK